MGTKTIYGELTFVRSTYGMVKFGGHIEAIREGDLCDSNLYLVPYNKMKLLIDEYSGGSKPNFEVSKKELLLDIGVIYDGSEQKQAEDRPSDEEIFIGLWKKALKDAEEDFHRARGEIWAIIFSTIADNDDTADPLLRGSHPGNAIKLYVDLAQQRGTNDADELLVRMKSVSRAATVNSEGLRKLVKKFDKHGQSRELSSKLLPLLYTSSLYTGQNMMQDSVGLLRELNAGEHDDVEFSTEDSYDSFIGTNRPFKQLVRRDSETRHQEALDIRVTEFNWLKSLVRSIPATDLLPKLVSHRGFHSTKDRNDKRPVENSLSAYEMAWTCGVELCECDIALTKDEKLVLAHDEDFTRLALDAFSDNSKRKVSDLTFKEIISMPLSNGARPPLLIDVLRSASAISERAKLVIEIKPGNEASAFALSRLLTRHPNLRSSVAMIMSFDAATMHRLKAALDRSIIPTAGDSGDRNTSIPHGMHRRVNSYDHFGTMSSSLLGYGTSPPNFRPKMSKLPSYMRRAGDSVELSSIGLSISNVNLESSGEEQQFSSAGFDSQNRDAHNMPKLMLLTVADPPNIPCELQVKHNELHRVDNWLKHDEGVLDGVYLQYEEGMKTPEGAAYLRELSQRFMVGIWGYADRDPDDFETFEVRKIGFLLRSNHL